VVGSIRPIEKELRMKVTQSARVILDDESYEFEPGDEIEIISEDYTSAALMDRAIERLDLAISQLEAFLADISSYPQRQESRVRATDLVGVLSGARTQMEEIKESEIATELGPMGEG